jgi:hypothetical protein
MAGESKIAKAIEFATSTSSKALGELRISVDKILWGNPAPTKNKKTSAKFEKTSTPTGTAQTSVVAVNTSAGPLSSIAANNPGTINPNTNPQGASQLPVSTPGKELRYKQPAFKLEKPKIGQSLTATGLFNALDALNSVDLCNVVSYAYDNINIKRQPRPERSTWTPVQVAFYTLQDQAGLVKNSIDKYRSYPNTFIGSYFGVGPNAVPPQQALTQSNAPVQGGTAVQKYNMYFLLQNIGEVFSFNTNTTGSLFTSEDAILLRQVPGLGSNLNFVNDFLGNVNKYTDYRQISTAEFQLLLRRVDELWDICNTIQNLNFRSATALVGNFIGIDIRSQVQKLSEFLNITKIIPTLRNINNNIRAFIRIAGQIQKIITTAQFIIKIAIFLYKIFRFLIAFFSANPLPSLFTTTGIQSIFQDAKEKAKDETRGVLRVLKSINALLGVATGFVRYLVVNANELLRRLDTMLLTLEACDAFKDSDVLNELQQTRKDLNTLLESLSTYIIEYDSKTDPDTALFGAYEIRIIDEQVVERTVTNLRRRGVALDQRGTIVTQSDLTFATNPEVIIGEVKQKLVSLGLVRPDLGALDSDALATISESLTFLDNNDVLQDDLNITAVPLDLPDNTNENQGIGLNAFVNNLPGGKRLRKRTRDAVATNRQGISNQIQQERVQGAQSLGGRTQPFAGTTRR